MSNDLREDDDYGWEFKIPSNFNEDITLNDFFAEQIIELQNIVKFFYKGEEVKIDSFCFKNNPNEKINLESYFENKSSNEV
jgi:hypothetical protein